MGADKSQFTGYTKIFDWNGTDWIQKGTTINGNQDSDFSSFSRALSADGTILAISAFGNDNGYARIFQINGADWVQ